MIRDQFWKPDTQTRSAIRRGNKLFKEYVDCNEKKYMALCAGRLGRLNESNRNAATNSTQGIDVHLITGKEGGQSMLDSTNEQESTAPAVNQQKERPAHWFKPGQSGNPKGRERGSKNHITKAFLEALTEDFLAHGKDVIERVRQERPDVYLKLTAMLVPKDLDVKHSGNVNVSIVNYADIDDQADSERIASNGSVPFSLVE